MNADSVDDARFLPQPGAFRDVPRMALAPVPLFLLQPILQRIVAGVVRCHPELFIRLGEGVGKRFLIDATNLPFVMLLRLDPDHPLLRAYRRGQLPAHDGRIAGSLLTLLDLVDGNTDSDALFFTRKLVVEGDTGAVVALRNAMDNTEGRLADDVVSGFGPLAWPAAQVLAVLREIRRRCQ